MPGKADGHERNLLRGFQLIGRPAERSITTPANNPSEAQDRQAAGYAATISLPSPHRPENGSPAFTGD